VASGRERCRARARRASGAAGAPPLQPKNEARRPPLPSTEERSAAPAAAVNRRTKRGARRCRRGRRARRMGARASAGGRRRTQKKANRKAKRRSPQQDARRPPAGWPAAALPISSHHAPRCDRVCPCLPQPPTLAEPGTPQDRDPAVRARARQAAGRGPSVSAPAGCRLAAPAALNVPPVSIAARLPRRARHPSVPPLPQPGPRPLAPRRQGPRPSPRLLMPALLCVVCPTPAP
jgi:hypothetical protein